MLNSKWTVTLFICCAVYHWVSVNNRHHLWWGPVVCVPCLPLHQSPVRQTERRLRLCSSPAAYRSVLPQPQWVMGPVSDRPLIVWPMNVSQRPCALLSGETAAVDSEAVFCQLFSHCPAEQFNDPMLAFEFVQFCLLNSSVLQDRVANYRQSFPNLLKVCWLTRILNWIQLSDILNVCAFCLSVLGVEQLRIDSRVCGAASITSSSRYSHWVTAHHPWSALLSSNAGPPAEVSHRVQIGVLTQVVCDVN